MFDFLPRLPSDNVIMIQICNDPNWAAIGEEPLLAAVIVDFAPQWAEWAGKDNFDESFLAELM